jgi:hypothetical protein
MDILLMDSYADRLGESRMHASEVRLNICAKHQKLIRNFGRSSAKVSQFAAQRWRFTSSGCPGDAENISLVWT